MTVAAVALRHVADVLVSNVDKKTVSGERAVRLCNYTDVYYKACITPDLDFMSASATLAQVAKFTLRGGDSVITKDSETASDIAVGAYVPAELPGVLCGYHLALIRPRMGAVDPAYLGWALQSTFMREQFTARASGVTRYGLTYEAIQGARVPFGVPRSQQLRIADFLDDQVTRIDAAITARLDQISGLQERQSGALQRVLLLPDDRLVMLRRLGVTLTTGPFGTAFAASQYVDVGVPMINPVHIVHGVLHPSPSHSVSEATASTLRRHRLGSGDIVTGRKGDLGRSAVIASHQAGWLCGSDAIAIRPDADRLSSEFLNAYLHLSVVRQDLLARSLAATMPSLNEDMLLSVPVPVLGIQEQELRAAQANKVAASHRSLVRSCTYAATLLQERKRALITAAVTGEFDVSTAGPRAAAAVTA